MDILPSGTSLKQCSKCSGSYPATPEFFYIHKKQLYYQCKECVKADRRSKREQRTEYMRQYRQTEKWKDYRKKRYVEHYAEHNEEIRRQQNQYYQEHHAEIRMRRNARGRTEQGRLEYRAHKHKRRAQKKYNGGSYTAQQLQEQLKRQKSKCYYCHAKLGKIWHADHVVPLSRGGSNTIDNVVVACPSCNMRKNDKLPHEWPEGGRLL